MHLRKIKNKRGFLLAEETIKIVLGLIVILILVVFLVALYYSNAKAQHKKEAIASINGKTMIKEKIGLIIDGKETKTNTSVLNPIGWYIFTFNAYVVKPNACSGENCLCICSKVWSINPLHLLTSEEKRQAEECNENGACLSVKNLIGDEKNPIEIIKGGTQIVFNLETNGISVSKI